MQKIIILGAGGHARVLVEALARSGAHVIGCVAPDEPVRPLPGIPYLGGDSVVCSYPCEEVVLVNGIGSVGRPDLRRQVFERFSALGYRFVVVIHPSAVLASDIKLEEGVQVMAGAIVQPGCYIGANTILNTGVHIDHDCQIDANVHLAPGAILSGNVKVGARTHVGTGACAIHGISIGANAVVGAGAVIVADIPDGVVVTGVPAKCIGKSST